MVFCQHTLLKCGIRDMNLWFACLCCIHDHNPLLQGLMQHHKEIVEYFNTRGVSTIFLFRRNLLRRMISILANSYDRDNKLLNGTHKSHVHSPREVSIPLSLSLTHTHTHISKSFNSYVMISG